MLREPYPYRRIKRIIFLSMVLVPLGVLTAILVLGYRYFSASIESTTVDAMRRIVADHREVIDAFLRERKGNLEFVVETYRFQELSKRGVLARVLANLQRESEAFVDLGVFDRAGIHVAYVGPYRLEGKHYGREAWFQEVLKEGAYMSDVFLGYRGVPHFVIAVAKQDPQGVWVLRATIDSQIFGRLVGGIRMGKTGEAYLLNAEGFFQTERRSGGRLMERDVDSIALPMSDTDIRTFVESDARGERYLYATAWLANRRWILVVRQEVNDAFQALKEATHRIAIAFLLGTGLVAALAFVLTGRIIGRMERLDAERELLGQQLITAGRLAELGEMAAGFAHEINNPLQIMRAEHRLVHELLEDLKERGELKPSEDLDEIEDSVKQIEVQIERCGKITESVLRFGRQDQPEPRNVDPGAFIPETVGMILKRASVSGVELVWEVKQGTPPVRGDPLQLQQVLLNLLNNALDAVLARHGPAGGRIRVECEAEGAGGVRIAVMDNGTGIRRENMDKLFTPFFTTKPLGQGTGLGLSVCYGIIERMGGSIEVKTEEGVGTTFTIRLPRAGRPVHDQEGA